MIRLTGRMLFLTRDRELIERQLRGEDLEWSEALALALRDDISTDEITPVYTMYHFDDRLGDYPYVGLRVGGETPIGVGAIRAGNFQVSVSGAARGKGSSREHAPYAELCAGIRIVIARSFHRIYLENCQNLGILTSTDFGLIPRLLRGEEIAISELT